MNRAPKTASGFPTNSFALLEPETGADSSESDRNEPESASSGGSDSKSNRRKERRTQKKKDGEEAAQAAAAAAARESARPPSRVLLLVGLPGSGKSTLAEAILAAGGVRWARVSQDELGNRQLCEQRMEELLADRVHVIVDRCNHDARQRAVWLQIARRARTAPVEVVHLDVPLDECVRRVLRRPSHPTLAAAAMGPQAAASIVYGFSKDFVRPLVSEGFGRLITFNASHATQHMIAQLQL